MPKGIHSRVNYHKLIMCPPTPEEIKATQAEFLEKYIECGNITGVLKGMGVNYSRFREWKKERDFMFAFIDAQEHACHTLEAEAWRRAVDGVEQPIFQNGREVGMRKEYSDVLLMFLMKGLNPGKYADRRVNQNINSSEATVLILPSNGREIELPDTKDGSKVTLQIPDRNNIEDAEIICSNGIRG